MRGLAIFIVILLTLTVPAQAAELTAPPAPDGALEYMPEESETFAQGLWKILRSALQKLQPDILKAAALCAALLGMTLLVSILEKLPGVSKGPVHLAAVVAAALLMLSNARTMVLLGADTVAQLSEYGKLLFPVLTAGMAAQGGISGSTSLYAATVAFDSVLGTLIGKLLVPLVYIFLALSIGNCAIGEDLLKKLKELIQWLITWSLKNLLYIFTGYMGITKVISGTTDAASLKAAKLTISGMVPVVGGILSEASEAVLVGAAVMKNAAGIYGLWAIASILLAPFLRIGVQYLLLKVTAALCAVFDVKPVSLLVQDFSSAMGFLLGMTGAVSMLLLVSIVCFMKGGV